MKLVYTFLIILAGLYSYAQVTTDPSFGNNGKVATGFGASNNKATTVAVLPDGKIIAGGSSYSAKSKNFGQVDSDNFTLIKYNSNGTFDNTFGIEGKVITDYYNLFPNQNFSGNITALKLQNDGKIVVIGVLTGLNLAANHTILSRYNSDGSLDSGFGINGIVFIDYFYSYSNQNTLLIQPDGKIIIGDINRIFINPTTTYSDFKIHRYNNDGSIDDTFGTDGVTITSFGNGFSSTNCIALQPDGKIIVAGGFSTTSNVYKIAIARYTSSGVLDTSFDTDGKVLTSLGASTQSIAYHVSVQNDGKILVAGNTYPITGASIGLFIAKYNSNGSLDTSFDTDGFAINNYSASYLEQIRSILVQPDGKIVTTHFVNYYEIVNTTDYVTRRFNTDAANDASFGSNGKVTTAVANGYNLANAVALQPDGKIVVAGYSYENPNVKTEVSVVRYTSNGNLDTSFSNDGMLTSPVESSNDDLSIVLVQPDDKLIAVGTKKNYATNGELFSDIILSKYNANGSLEPSFGNEGKVTSSFGQNLNRIIGAIVQPDGSIVLANSYTTFLDSTQHSELIKYHNNGNIDTNFGSNGKLSTNPLVGLISQADGKIIFLEVTTNNQNNTVFTVKRYHNNGTADASFNTDGGLDLIENLNVLSNTIGKNIAIQNDGKIVLCFTAPNQNNISGIKVIRLNADGSIDSSFSTPAADDFTYADAVFIKPDNKIVVTGSDFTYFKTFQYHPDGSIDTAYGTNGILSSTLDTNYRTIKDVFFQPDGKFIVALSKYADPLENYDFVTRRFNTDGTNDYDFGLNSEGQITTAFYNTYDEIASIVLQSDNKIILAGTTRGLVNRDFAMTRITNNILSINDLNYNLRNIILYPNPTFSYLNIAFPKNIDATINTLKINDIVGKEVYKLNQNNTNIDVSALSKGVYIITLQTNHGVWNGKFVKE